MDVQQTQDVPSVQATPPGPHHSTRGGAAWRWMWTEGTLLLAYGRRRPRFLLGLIIILLAFILAVTEPIIIPYSPISVSADVLQPPSLTHLMGTDPTGMDIFSRVLAALRIDLAIALGGTLLSFALAGDGLREYPDPVKRQGVVRVAKRGNKGSLSSDVAPVVTV